MRIICVILFMFVNSSLLLGDGLDDRTPSALIRAASQGNAEEAKWLKEGGEDIHELDEHGKTLLHYAARHGHLPLVNFFIGCGLNFRQADFFGRTPLHDAAMSGSYEVVECLLQKAVDHALSPEVYINKEDMQKKTPLSLAKEEFSSAEESLARQDLSVAGATLSRRIRAAKTVRLIERYLRADKQDDCCLVQ
ncbi:MAG: ankyrin repeat domain-containing protein [Deltaproteobacteria bacterium]|nr:ankyrin repeat domain-containing protein [Deltaproteobacteria bacterium]